MQKIYLIMFTLALILPACGVQATPVATESAPAPEATALETVNIPTLEPTQAPAPTNTEQSTTPGVATYRIVAGESRLQYEVGEVFLNQNNRFNVAVGVTTQISGDIQVDLAEPQKSNLGPITADISQFTSDNNRRDNALRDRFIESRLFPNVTFVAREISGLPASYQEGQLVPLQISGDLTIRETTRPVTFEATVTIAANTLTGEATTTILMSDFGFGPIDIIGILKTEDEAKISLSFVARP
ncbi:MAG TPA: YceI family protein [Anaerolineales bacterium]|nr:YceI family protein [Anaerolineales bacterium]